MSAPDTPAEAEGSTQWDDPLAVRVGVWAGVDDLPAEGWPDTFNEAAVRRILGALDGT